MRCPNLVSVGFALTLVFLVQCASTPEDAAAPDATAEIAAAHAARPPRLRSGLVPCTHKSGWPSRVAARSAGWN